MYDDQQEHLKFVLLLLQNDLAWALMSSGESLMSEGQPGRDR